ncbi:PfkB family carbohydrate kinase [Bacteriovoracaceae bacterium]|nr:PfkB family carbohydrate kinase [Bacteriovoracaceae bacterium]
MNELLFIGDIGLDIYPDQTLPGGCSLNAATRAKFYCDMYNLNLKITLAGPSSISKSIIDDYLQSMDISKLLFKREGSWPTQIIENLPNGEKSFIKYEEGVFKDFFLTTSEKCFLNNFSGHVVMPVFAQALSFNHSVIDNLHKAKIFLDFFDLTDFNRNINDIKSMLNQSHGAFFGLNKSDKTLINEIKQFSQSTGKPCLVTLGKDGAVYFDDKEYSVDAKKVNVIDTTGAGDTFIATFMSAKISGENTEDALKYARDHSAEVVAQKGCLITL